LLLLTAKYTIIKLYCIIQKAYLKFVNI